MQSELCFTLPHPSPLSVCLLLAVKRRPYFALFVPQLLPPTFSLLTVGVQSRTLETTCETETRGFTVEIHVPQAILMFYRHPGRQAIKMFVLFFFLVLVLFLNDVVD